METIVEAQGLTKTYAQGDAAMRALDDVSLDVRRGELMLLVGPSGSGKTTLLSILGCILRPTAGTLRVMDVDITRLVVQAALTLVAFATVPPFRPVPPVLPRGH